MVEIIGYFAAFLSTSSLLPQVITSIKKRNTAGISFLMYLLSVMAILSWLAYGIFLEDMAIILSNIITLFCAITILIIKIQNIRRKLEPLF